VKIAKIRTFHSPGAPRPRVLLPVSKCNRLELEGSPAVIHGCHQVHILKRGADSSGDGIEAYQNSQPAAVHVSDVAQVNGDLPAPMHPATNSSPKAVASLSGPHLTTAIDNRRVVPGFRTKFDGHRKSFPL